MPAKPTVTEVRRGKPFVPSIDREKLVQALRAIQEGETIQYRDLTAAIGRDVRQEGRHVLYSAKEHLRERGEAEFAPVPGVGLRRLASAEIAPVVGSKTRVRVGGATRRGVKALGCADYGKLSNEDRVKHNTAAGWMGAIRQAVTPQRMRELERHVSQSSAELPVGRVLEVLGGREPEKEKK